MSPVKLEQMFKPTSVAVIGATDEPGDPGNTILKNLLGGKFLGPVLPVNPDVDSVMGMPSYSAIDTLPLTPDLAILCSPPETIPYYIEELGKRGTQHAVIMSRGYFRFNRDKLEVQKKALLSVARKFNVRVLGPNCLGYINPSVGINASLASRDALPGKVAFVTQSDSLFTTVLDWAASKNIGFSHFISLGDRYDIHFEDVLNYLNNDFSTRAILLYIETIENARQFLSAVRALARNKPVLVIKAGRSEAGAAAAAAHSGMLLGSDDVYDTAFRRAGMLRVFDIDTLFDTVETIALARPLKGERLAIITNGGGPGFLATDMLLEGGGRLADISDTTCQALDDELGNAWSYWNPLILKSDADGEMYAATIRQLLLDSEVDALLIMHVPTTGTDSAAIAEHVIKACKKTKKLVLTSWMGIDDAEEARKRFTGAGFPSFFTPDKAVRAFLNLVQYRRNQEMLVEAPASLPDDYHPDTFMVRNIIVEALEDKRQMLTEQEARAILTAYGIPIVETRTTTTADEAADAAEAIGFPVALKVISPDIYRKSLAGGVALDLETRDQVQAAVHTVTNRVRQNQPDARISGYSIQRMSRRARARELAVETATDPVFGPIIRFGQGGSLASITHDRQTALPPLNMSLANELISRTKIVTLLRGNRDIPAANLDAVRSTLVKISQLIIDIPEIFELEIDPLFADEEGVVALDANIRVAWSTSSGTDQLAIRPYPKELEECVQLRNGAKVDLRPIRPEDEPDHWDFLEHMSPEDKRFRFFGNVATLPRSEMIKLTQIDYDREMAFIAKGEAPDGSYKTLGVARAMIQPDNSSAEFAVAVRSDLKRLGLGRLLMEKIIRYLQLRKTRQITGAALSDNKNMIELARNLGFDVTKDLDDDVHHFEMTMEEEA
ncbi:acetate--CoA ligase family protein [Desulfovibrio subterraneus]|uniref:Acetyltransferase n=1 Tax=Desulfovibrio subterraneus TaxID=2718620 RepID=A0A7J0BHN4_9BACT|nr:acetate--CoA ligase family protein [Desulfovibrio subterraneus]WBF66888.1 acetate--CoA ligase family protein [Desulfovibrio subterraneus]GFM32615.1 acetyltransferase [Desulfovibrio subterraneus]